MSKTSFLLEFQMGPNVRAFSTRRHGAGVSVGAYGEMNVNPFCGDEPEVVKENTAILAAALGLAPESIILPHQIHEVGIKVIDEAFLLKSPKERTELLEGIDALITNLPNVCIGVSTADCVPILLYDRKLRVAAAVHAGWRGTVKKIAEKTVQAMQGQFGCDAKDITAQIGPSISLQSFEVGDEVYDEFHRNGFDMSRIAARQDGRWHIDLWEANALLLQTAGLHFPNIRKANICTYLQHEDFFSARRLTINSGRIYSGIVLGYDRKNQ